MVVKNSNNFLNYIFTLLAYILILLPTIYVLYLCVERGHSLAIWHVAGFTVSCGLLMMVGTLSVSGDAFLVSTVSRIWRVRIHWILHFLGLVLTGVGMLAVYINKERAGRAHFVSDHAIVGLVGVVLTVVAALNGVMTLYPKSFCGCIGLGPIKIFHAFIGIAATILMFAGQITGVYTAWWRGAELGRNLTVAAYVVGMVFVFIKPTFSMGSRIRALFN